MGCERGVAMYWSLHYSLPIGDSFPSSTYASYPEEQIILMIGTALKKCVPEHQYLDCYWHLMNFDDRSFEVYFRLPDDSNLDFDFKYEIANRIEMVNRQKKLECEADDELVGFDIQPITDLDFLDALFYLRVELINGDRTHPD